MVETLDEILRKALEYKGSDVFVVPGSQIMTKASGKMIPITQDRALPNDIAILVDRAYELAGRTRETLHEEGDDDFSFAVRDLSRFRCNTYRQRGSLAMTCRVVAFGIPDPQDCHIPDVVMRLADFRSGMILVTGPAGNGKSTTLACLVDKINRTRSGHIITIEDPIEYLHPHKQCLVSQREVPGDASTFARALRAALRQAPDVIMLGEMRDIETISTAITAAETGHLLLSSLHTLGAAKTIDRVIDAFPANQQNQIRAQLSMVLRAVVSQRLILTKEGKLHPVFEVMCVNPAIQNLIREGKTHQIDNAIFGGGADMLSMDTELARLLRDGKIDKEQAALLAIHPETVERQARFMRD
ncbi:MAG: PilT/PilU family type 4a pilus ATPase [Clostridia bacterium]|jgi:twitching motility protein PilT|nr:PilT/PilU family type 4a pilus ATPase [Clostridia bacterium]